MTANPTVRVSDVISERKKSREDKLIHAILSAQLALNMNEDLKNSVPRAYKSTLKNRTSNYLNELIKHEKDFDLFFDKEENSLVQVYDVLQKFIEVISVIPLWEMENFNEVIKAYLKDKSSIEGIVRKINRN